jgi:hypothetical protein
VLLRCNVHGIDVNNQIRNTYIHNTRYERSFIYYIKYLPKYTFTFTFYFAPILELDIASLYVQILTKFSRSVDHFFKITFVFFTKNFLHVKKSAEEHVIKKKTMRSKNHLNIYLVKLRTRRCHLSWNGKMARDRPGAGFDSCWVALHIFTPGCE